MVSIYRDAVRAVAANLPAFAFHAAALVGIDQAPTPGLRVALLIGLWPGLLFLLHRTVLLGVPLAILRPGKGGMVGIVRFHLLLVLLLGLTILGSVPIARAFDPGPAAPVDPELWAASLRGATVAIWAFFIGLLALLGTALPAAVAGETRVLLGALRRCGLAAPAIVFGLLAGPGPLVAVLMWGGPRLAERVEAVRRPVWDGRFDPSAAAFAMVDQGLGLLVATLGVAALCRAYRLSRPDGAGGLPSAARLLRTAPAR